MKFRVKRRKYMFCGTVRDRKTSRPLEGVAVCDGMNIAFTDSEGGFCLPGWEKAKVIFISALTRDHSDWYINVDVSRESYDFYVTLENAEGDFSVFHCSDIEIDDEPCFSWMDFMRREVASGKPAFFINTGDLARTKLHAHYLAMNRETVGCPVRYCIGNHDFSGIDYGEQIYEHYYGPTWYSFDYGDVHFVFLSLLMGDKTPLYTREEQARWLKNDLDTLARGKKVFVFCHTWLSYLEWNEGDEPKNGTVNLRDYEYLGSAVGHHHVNVLHEDGGVLSICSSRPDSGGIDSSAGAIRRISFTDGKVSSALIHYTNAQPEAADSAVWKQTLDGTVEFSDPITDGERIFVATNDDGYPKACGIYALDKSTGEVVWQINTKDGFKGGLAYSDGIIYAESTRGTLYYITAIDGKILRKIDVFDSPTSFSSSTPLIVKDKVIVGKNSPVYAYDKKTGELIWSATALPRQGSSPAKCVYDEKRGNLIISINWLGLVALNVDTGEVVWQTEKAGRHIHFRTATPVIDGDRIILGSLGYGTAVDANTGAIIGSHGLGGRMDSVGAPTIDGENIYFPSGTAGVIEVNRETLEAKRKFPAGTAIIHTTPYVRGARQTVEGSPTVIGNRLIFADSAGYIMVYEKDTARLLRKISVGAPVTATPLIDGDSIIVADYFGGVSKFKL